jgi:NTP pyrophosphatase (non-canonical NTP hydrolase)
VAFVTRANLQSRAATWHAARFPGCAAEDIVLKAMAELGEVADAVLARGRDDSHPERAGTVTDEAADVVIPLLALVGRFTAGDLLAAVDAKLAILEQPGGAHPASLPERTNAQ